MKIRNGIIGLFLIFLLSGCHSTQDSNTKTSLPKTPNLVVILVDDMGWADVGFNGCEDIPTPNIDKIAKEGVRFSEGYVTFPTCGPSRAGLLTGRYQDRFGFTTNPSIDPHNPLAGLPIEEETMAQVLRKADYQSAIIGKWHLGSYPSLHPLERGFDYFFGFLSGGHRYFPEELDLKDLSEVTRKWQWYRTKIIENRQTVEITDYLTDELSDAAIKFIDDQAATQQHFFLYLAYNAPHTPLQATEKYLSRFPNISDPKRKKYAAMVSAVDDGVGRILQTLQDADIDKNTLVVFLSDNGGATNNGSNNGPLRGAKGDLFDGGLRVPFAMRWSSVIPAGQTYEKSISSLDIMATIVDINHIPIHEARPLDGVNLIPFITGQNEGAPHDFLFWRKWRQNAMAIRKGPLKVVANHNQDTLPPALYDMTTTEELLDQKDQNSVLYDALILEWSKWNSQLKDEAIPSLSTDVWWTDQ